MADTEARWYCVNAIGQATLCSDRRDAEHESAMADKAWPVRAPHRAVQLGDVGALVAERDSLLRDWVAEQGARTAAVERAERAELERDRLRAQVDDMRTAVHSCHPGCSNARCVAERLRADVAELVECLDGAYALAIGHAATYKFNHELEEVHPTHAAILDAARALLAKHDPLQALADNARELGMTYEDGSKT